MRTFEAAISVIVREMETYIVLTKIVLPKSMNP